MSHTKVPFCKNQYLPTVRTGYSPAPHDLISSSPSGDDTLLPNTVTDDIVVNNIASAEFDYTEKSYIDSGLNLNPWF